MKETEKKTGPGTTRARAPKQAKAASGCSDSHCPFHGSLSVRGRVFTERVTSAKSHRTATVLIEWRNYIKKFERFEKRRKRLHVHNPDCINAREGDIVKVMECRPISKTKNFVIIEKVTKQ